MTGAAPPLQSSPHLNTSISGLQTASGDILYEADKNHLFRDTETYLSGVIARLPELHLTFNQHVNGSTRPLVATACGAGGAAA